ncbi:DUF2339 domain-containing protein [Amycolatopsis sp. H20-H5]|uniref:DUF2339 domain-containing protein n=1 Tax=Amycolatopsis sp. H20-H5 TaxID=3046309 RepID=UPI002DB56DBF|nr:DUF2339 domain-containing protein [Amycolatopsis sp. H20-H5]MEC3980139.1 DUF2339 domain-containing protein [Amycolatopsis sp. H20-H5]
MPTDGDVLLKLAGEIDDLGRRLGQVGAELRTFRSGQQPEQAAPAPMPQPMPQPGYGWQQPPVQQWHPPQQQWAPMPAPIPPVPRRSLAEKLGQEGAGSRLLAWVGGAVTLLGVVLFLVLAIQRGWLGPLPRVLVGAGLGVGMIGTGLWLHRNPAGRTGAFALAATGIAVLYLDAIAATTLYDFLPSVAGLAVGLVVAVGGLLLASRWDSALLATAVVIGCAVCAPMITPGFTPELVTFLLMVQLATIPLQLRKEWTSVAIAAGIPPVLASVISTAVAGLPGNWANTAAALGAGVAGVGVALIVTRRRPTDLAALSLLAIAVVPSLFAALLLPKAQAVPVAAGVGVVLLGVWAVSRWLPGHAGDVAGAAGLIAVLQATVVQFDGSARSAILLGEAVLLAVVALRTRRKVAMRGSLGFAVLGAVFALAGDLPPVLLLVFRSRPTGEIAGACLVAALLLVVSVTLPWVASRLGALRQPSANVVPWLAAGIAALYGAAGVVLCGSLLVQPGRSGFLLGHVLITMSWTVVALVLLIRGIGVVALRVIGLVLVGAAVVKLVLFDLSALDGMARVAAFLGAGLILLAAGTRYARLVSSR